MKKIGQKWGQVALDSVHVGARHQRTLTALGGMFPAQKGWYKPESKFNQSINKSNGLPKETVHREGHIFQI